MKIEILWFSDCPNYQRAADLLREVLRAETIAAAVEMVQVVDDADARAQKFLGSPTIRLNGVDPFALPAQTQYALQCRVYRTPDGLRGMPTREMLKDAVRRANDAKNRRGAEGAEKNLPC
ncbi:MAG: hypothetical protein HY327_03090 [Chloroflexi bacterium]|nr:hypothetical protein [Chloroflexota bacterium]